MVTILFNVSMITIPLTYSLIFTKDSIINQNTVYPNDQFSATVQLIIGNYPCHLSMNIDY